MQCVLFSTDMNLFSHHYFKRCNMKKTLLMIFALAGTIAASAQTINFEIDGLKYETTSANTARVTEVATSELTVDVPATVEHDGTTYTVNSIGEEAFYYSKITKLTLPETVDSIYKRAFATTQFAEIKLPSKLVYIADYAFNSSNIENLVIPASVDHIGYGAFFTCKKLNTVKFEGNVKTIDSSIFYHTPVTKVTLADDMTQIPTKMFLKCDKLAEINWPANLESIGSGAFYDCVALKTSALPATVKEIGDEAFLNCSSITSVNLPAALEKLGSCAFSMTSINDLTIDSNNANFKLVDGVLYSKDGRLLYLVQMKGLKNVNVTSQCIGINGGAFWGSEVETVTLPKSMLAIDDYAFCQSALKSINFPSSLVFVGEQGFASTKLAGELRLPVNMPIVSDGAFAGNKGITSVVIPSLVKYVYAHAFHNCNNLATITCEGSKAPEFVNVYEDYDSPFYNIMATEVNIPKGSADSYRSEYWTDYLALNESDKAVLAVVSTSPESGATFSEKDFTAAFDITFGEPVTIVEEHPDAYLRVSAIGGNPLLSGNVLQPDDVWYVTYPLASKETVRIWAADNDSYTMSYASEADKEYTLVVPAGIVKNAAGELNEQIVISVKGYDPSTGIADATVAPSVATEVSRYNVNGMKIGKNQKGIAIVKMSDGSVKKVLVK